MKWEMLMHRSTMEWLEMTRLWFQKRQAGRRRQRLSDSELRKLYLYGMQFKSDLTKETRKLEEIENTGRTYHAPHIARFDPINGGLAHPNFWPYLVRHYDPPLGRVKQELRSKP